MAKKKRIMYILEEAAPVKLSNKELFANKLNKLFKVLTEDLGFEDISALYIIKFYVALKKNNLLEAPYFNLTGSFKKGNPKGLIKNLDEAIKHPRVFVEAILNVMHSPKFLRQYDINFEYIGDSDLDTEVSITKKQEEEAIETGPDTSPFPEAPRFDKYIVNQDDNWISYEIPNKEVSREFQTYYQSRFSGHPVMELLKSINRAQLFNTTYCIHGDSDYFSSQKSNPRDKWFITYSKKSLINLLCLIAGIPYSPEMEETVTASDSAVRDFVIKALEMFSDITRTRSGQEDPRNYYFGELFLWDSLGKYSHPNTGPHNFNNNPGGARSGRTAILKPAMSYNYPDYNQRHGIKVAGGVLEYAITSEDNFNVPLGVTEVAADAFEGSTNLKTIIFPPSLRVLRKHALRGLPKIRTVILPDTTEIIEFGALELSSPASLQKLQIGVPLDDDEELAGKFRKPRSLKYLPSIYDHLFAPDPQDKKATEDPAYELKRPAYIEEGFVRIENNILTKLDIRGFCTLKSKTQESTVPTEYVMPDYVEGIDSDLKFKYAPAKVVVGPKVGTITSSMFNYSPVGTSVPHTGATIILGTRILDLSEANIAVIPEGLFKGAMQLRTVILPKKTKVIGKYAFAQSYINTLVLPFTLTKNPDYDPTKEDSAMYLNNGVPLVVHPDALSGSIIQHIITDQVDEVKDILRNGHTDEEIRDAVNADKFNANSGLPANARFVSSVKKSK